MRISWRWSWGSARHGDREAIDRLHSAQERLIVTPQDEGADTHAIGTSLSLMSQLVFDWLDEMFD